MWLAVKTHKMQSHSWPLLPSFSHHIPLSVWIIVPSISLSGSQDMRWKINQSELWVHSALSWNTRSDGGLTQSSAATPLSAHLQARRIVEIAPCHSSLSTNPYLPQWSYMLVVRLFKPSGTVGMMIHELGPEKVV